jgi:hypothetical protein
VSPEHVRFPGLADWMEKKFTESILGSIFIDEAHLIPL